MNERASIRGLINFELKSIRPILAWSKADAAMICTSAYKFKPRYHVSTILPSILIFPLILIFHPLSRNKRNSRIIFISPVSLRYFCQSYFLAVKRCCLVGVHRRSDTTNINSCRRCRSTRYLLIFFPFFFLLFFLVRFVSFAIPSIECEKKKRERKRKELRKLT